MKTKLKVVKKTFRSEVKRVINAHSGRDMFMVLEPIKLNIWNVLFKRQQLLATIETNYVILANEKYMLVQEIGELYTKK